MKYERKLILVKEEKEKEILYYVKKRKSISFDCVMFNVGIREDGKVFEIEDFSPDEKQADDLVDYLYERNVTGDNLFEASEEFIVTF